jgi:DnaJ-class molecular chaperone
MTDFLLPGIAAGGMTAQVFGQRSVANPTLNQLVQLLSRSQLQTCPQCQGLGLVGVQRLCGGCRGSGRVAGPK